jgi:preprotein translocase subunit SecD
MNAFGIARRRVRGLPFLFSGLLLIAASSAIETAVAETAELQVETARVIYDERMKESVVSIKWAKPSADMLRDITTRNVGKTMELHVDRQLVVKAVIREPILGGSTQISGHFTEEQARQIGERLPAGVKVAIEIND